MKKVLIVEDDPQIVNLLKIHLIDLNYELSVASNGLKGYQLASEQKFDLIILDITLPEMDGITVCQKIRRLEHYVPILMLTAKAEEIDKVLGLESGADDYMTKPFGIRELLARVKALLRREEQITHKTKNAEKLYLQIDKLEIDENLRKVTLDNKRIDLTPKEFDLLLLMARNPGRSYDREQLLSQIWGYEFNGYEHTVNSHINRLRTKIEPKLTSPKYILTTWGIGYRFNEDLLV
jgi:two-component system alkaline phosphatase synthesis response regulator PhoP